MKNLPDHYSEGSAATSRAAHATIDKQSQRDVVLDWWLAQPRGATLREAADAIVWKGHQIAYSALSARYEELRAMGALRRIDWKPPHEMRRGWEIATNSGGRKRKNPSGRLAFIYVATIGGWDQGVVEYHEQVRLERGEKCPVCSGTGYLRQAQASDDEPIVQKKLWR